MQHTSTPRSLKEKQRLERENLILQVAEEVFHEKGYHDTSMEEIAARVGVAKGTVYLHFPSKEDLVIAIFTRDIQKFSQAVDETINTESKLSARAKLEAILYFLCSGFYRKRAQLLYTIEQSVELRRTFVEKKGRMRQIWEQLAQRISMIIEEGKAAGEFDPSIPTNVMLSVFFSLQSPRSYEHLGVGEQMPVEELVQHLGRIYFKGVMTR
jgi:TetR/AcrR family fatty acid metabolism transcriptional regulator